jgi:hypothetical protein
VADQRYKPNSFSKRLAVEVSLRSDAATGKARRHGEGIYRKAMGDQLGAVCHVRRQISYLQQRKAEIEPDSAQDVDASLVDSRGRYSPIGLGSEIAARFRGAGFKDGEILELRGFTIEPPTFEE